MCPVCAVAVGVGLGLSRWLKIDDTISGLWIGALIVSLSFILAKWTKKYLALSVKLLTFLYFVVLLLTIFIPLSYLHIIGNPLNTKWGMDKLAFGTGVGIIVFLFSLFIHGFLKYRHHNKSYFPFQKVIIPVDMLLLASLIMYWLVR
jgi:hypothetical protein